MGYMPNVLKDVSLLYCSESVWSSDFPGIPERVNMTHFLMRAFINVLDVELPYTNHLQSSTQGVAGPHSMRDFLGP